MELREGYKNTEVGIIPDDWEVKKLNSLTEFITKGSTPTTYGFSWQQSGILFLRSECVSERGLDLSQSMFISELAHKVLRRSEIKSNDILITITGNVGRLVYLEDDFGIGNINQHIGKIRIVKDEVDKYYIYHFLAQPPFQKYFSSIVTGQAYPQLSLKQVREAPISLPPTKAEQTAIATALSDTDALISGLEKLIAKKRNIKQGAIQKLLQPKEGWEVKKLGDIGDVKMCRRVFNNETSSNGLIPFYKIGTFGKDADAYISKELYDEYRLKFSFPQKGEILISAAGTIGRTIIYDGEDAYFQDSNIVWIDNNQSIVSNDFLYHILQVVKFNTEGGTIQRLYNSILMATKFGCPPKEEQSRIATILSDMDNEITALETKLEKYKKVKLGMMQNLLTGKIRLI